ncbi:MAG: DNA-binding response regulator [Calditrichaeota bacterium]|nr:MAG: DNA-binding response regulator [Calditrichota bacterium]
MIRAMIVEDEQPAADRLQTLLEEQDDLEVIGVYASGREAAEAIELLQPDLLFLDVQLSDISGLDVLKLISHKPAVVFTTAYDQYAIEAFELRAIDYLLKPFSRERLLEAVERVKEHVRDKEDSVHRLQELLANWQPQQPFLRRIPSKIGDRIYILNDDDIVYFGTENKLVFAHLTDKKYLINYTLEELQSRLDPEKFFRIHRSTIVNLNYVKTIESWFGGGYKMTVKDKANSELIISRAAGKQLRQKLGW